jgi:hypothetical protein
MSNPNSRKILECYRLAAEARRIADAATDQFERADFLEVEQRWLSLARSADLWQQTEKLSCSRMSLESMPARSPPGSSITTLHSWANAAIAASRSPRSRVPLARRWGNNVAPRSRFPNLLATD